MAPRVKDPKRVTAGQRAAVTRAARARGVDPARSWAARQGWATRRNNADHAARVHGQRAREATEKRLTPSQKAKRTRDANRIARETRERPGPARAPKRGRALHSLEELDEYDDRDDGDEYEAEGHQETTRKRKRG